MQASQLAKAYKSNSVSTVSPGAIILMLFDSLLLSVDVALEGFAIENVARRNEQIHNSLAKVQQLLYVLQAALDMEIDGEFSKQMYSLYDFMIAEVQKANVGKVEEPIRVVRGMMQEIRDAWSEMLLQEIAAS